ncbi:hypothetical protein H0X09_00265 [Candidatus Saccharibacteria bacterium]|nr:hypothetical protein [Candidatus Saccharibacteria bacterium]
MNSNKPYLSRFDAGRGASETQTEPYFKYGDVALELATTACAKSISSVFSSAKILADVSRRIR